MLCGCTEKTFKGQHYRKLRRQCLRKQKLFKDEEFPPTGSSLYFSRSAPSDIEWKRPRSIVEDPKFFIDKASADNFSQGSLGNCWFVAACACIADNNSNLWKKVVPDYKEQVFTPDSKYAGIFHFKFWRCGSWVDVVIDDYLPTREGRLIYTHSKSRNEFWSALLEKAYAKLFGSYEALTSGNARDAMVDMTGGVGEKLEVADFKKDGIESIHFSILLKTKSRLSLMCASIEARSAAEMETKLDVGLVRGHAYSITGVKEIPLKGTGLFSFFNREKIHMVRLRNPWGAGEWKGPWSDGSREWKRVSVSQKKKLGLTFDEDGEFWMAFEDFCLYFTKIEICHMVKTSFSRISWNWKEAVGAGKWTKRKNMAGGCRNHESFLQNPQYLLELSQDGVELMVSLEQEDKRSSNVRTRGENYSIGFSIMKTDLNRKCRMHDRLEYVTDSGSFVQARSILTRLELKKGRYCLIPSTFDPGLEGRYLLRIYSDGGLTLKHLIKDVPRSPRCYQKPKVAATVVFVHYADLDGFDITDAESGIEGYCILKCEGQKVRTSTTSTSTKPKWEERVTFYRQKPTEDVVIEVWGKTMPKDYLVGTTTLPMSEPSEYRDGSKLKWFKLVKNNDKGEEVHRGFMWVKVKHTTNFWEV